MDTYTSSVPAQKLKDSCDACSAFKLRCDKQKPTCVRCANLNRTCTYSPARRVGRPHSVRRQSQGQHNKDKGKSQGKSQSGSPNGSSTSGSGTEGAGSHQQRRFGLSEPLNAGHSGATEAMGVAGRTPDRAAAFERSYFPPGMRYAAGHHADDQSTLVASPPCNSDNTMLSTGLDPETPSETLSETDCTKVALSIIEQLEVANRGWHPATPTFAAATTTAAAAAAAAAAGGSASLTATEACRRLLAILVCPCSEQTEVALLVASACMSLMDLVDQGSAGATSDQQSVSVDLSYSNSSTPVSEQDIFMWSRPQSSSHGLAAAGGDGQSQIKDLLKIAKVVKELTDRYCQSTKGGPRWEHTTWVVAPVANLLRCRLQSVTQGATRSLVA